MSRPQGGNLMDKMGRPLRPSSPLWVEPARNANTPRISPYSAVYPKLYSASASPGAAASFSEMIVGSSGHAMPTSGQL